MSTKSIVDKYTFRIHWMEQRLLFRLDCDEVPMPDSWCDVNPDSLLAEGRREIRSYADRLKGRGTEPPRPLHPDRARAITESTLAQAKRECYSPHLPGRRDPYGQLPLSGEERRMLEDAFGWHRFCFLDVDDAILFRQTYESLILLRAAATALAERWHDAGDCGRASGIQLGVAEMEYRFVRLNPNNRRKALALMTQCLKRTVAHLQGLRHPEPDQSDLSILRARLVQGTKPDGSHPAESLLRVRWPWAMQMLELERGWSIRFGADLISDMQMIIDMGLNGFALQQVKEKYGGLRVYFDDDCFDVNTGEERSGQWIELSELMHDLIEVYEVLSMRTCIRCGSFRDIRWTAGYWRYPLCRRCAHADGQCHWDDMGRTSLRPMGEWLSDVRGGINAPRFSNARFRHLAEQCDRQNLWREGE